MNSEFGRGPSPDRGHAIACCGGQYTCELSETVWWRSMEELVPIFEREGVTLSTEAARGDLVRDAASGIDMIQMIGSKNVRFLYCTPQTFYFGDDMGAMIRETASSLRMFTSPTPATTRARRAYPPEAKVMVHQHMDMHQSEVDWDIFFSSPAEVGFDGIMTARVFAWRDRSRTSSRFMRGEMQKYVDKYWK